VFLYLFSVSMTCSLFIMGDKSWQKFTQITRENICHRYSTHEKPFATGIVPVARYIVTRCQVYCSKIVHSDYLIKIQHFRMLCTKTLCKQQYKSYAKISISKQFLAQFRSSGFDFIYIEVSYRLLLTNQTAKCSCVCLLHQYITLMKEYGLHQQYAVLVCPYFFLCFIHG
jgi:hypothetical protein